MLCRLRVTNILFPFFPTWIRQFIIYIIAVLNSHLFGSTLFQLIMLNLIIGRSLQNIIYTIGKY